MDLDAFRYYTAWNDAANRRNYAAPADPWRPVHVDPDSVERFAVVELTWGLGRVRGGDWDRPEECRDLTDTRLYEELVERFEDRLDWEDTVYDDPTEIEYVHEMEPMVLIGHAGDVIWTEGFHRLILARLAGIDAIPVYVLRRHEGWQRTRDEFHGTTADDRSPELAAHADHPDLRDLAE